MSNEAFDFTALDSNDDDDDNNNNNSDSAPVLSVATATQNAPETQPSTARTNKRYLQCVFLVLLALSLSLFQYESLPRRLENEISKLKLSKPRKNETAVSSTSLSSCAHNILIHNIYSNSNSSINGTIMTTTYHYNKHHRLELLHIPKTAGSTLEHQAAAVGIAWGACHWLQQDSFSSNCPPHPKRSSLHHPELKVSFWHLPLQQLEGYYSPYDDTTVDLFLVVRNPYARIVSQWNYLFDMPWPTPAALKQMRKSNATHMNAFLQQVLPLMRNRTSEQYYAYDGHFVPQIDFIQNNSAVVAVLRQESLHRDFACLMDLYELNVTLPEHSVPSSLSNNSTNMFVHKQGSLTVRDLHNDVRQLIANVYRQDFETFGYEI